MIRIAFMLLAAVTTVLLPAIAHADIVAYYTTGQSLYVRFDDASNTAVNLNERTCSTCASSMGRKMAAAIRRAA